MDPADLQDQHDAQDENRENFLFWGEVDRLAETLGCTEDESMYLMCSPSDDQLNEWLYPNDIPF